MDQELKEDLKNKLYEKHKENFKINYMRNTSPVQRKVWEHTIQMAEKEEKRRIKRGDNKERLVIP